MADRDTDYLGTFSKVPVQRTSDALVTPTSAKRERGKVKGNKRNPRSHTIALTDCKVTRADGTTYTIAANGRKAGKRKAAPRKVVTSTPDAGRTLATVTRPDGTVVTIQRYVSKSDQRDRAALADGTA